MRRITTGGTNGEDMIVSKGLSGGESVIVEGIQTLRPGMTVRAKPATPALTRG